MQAGKRGRKAMPEKRIVVAAFSATVLAQIDAVAIQQSIPNRSEILRLAVSEYLVRRQQSQSAA